MGTSPEDNSTELLLDNDEVLMVDNNMYQQAITRAGTSIEDMLEDGPVGIIFKVQGDQCLTLDFEDLPANAI